MTGSLKWFPYTDDFGTVYAINLDESNTEAVNGTLDYTGTPPLVDAVPRNVRPRSLYYGTTDGLRTIKVVALTPAIYSAAVADNPTIPDPITTGITLVLQRLVPERRRLPIPNDTGLQDGDIT